MEHFRYPNIAFRSPDTLPPKPVRNVVCNVEMREELVVLKNKPDIALCGRNVGDFPVIELQGATINIDKARNC